MSRSSAPITLRGLGQAQGVLVLQANIKKDRAGVNETIVLDDSDGDPEHTP